MKLPKIEIPLNDIIPLSQHSADFLVELYYEMINVHKKKLKFDQDKCDYCVIGNGLRAGVFKAEDFWPAIEEIRLPEDDVGSEISNFLFGTNSEIYNSTEDVRLPNYIKGIQKTNGYKYNTLDACVRIAAVLDMYGYEVKDLPNIPKS